MLKSKKENSVFNQEKFTNLYSQKENVYQKNSYFNLHFTYLDVRDRKDLYVCLKLQQADLMSVLEYSKLKLHNSIN